MRPERTKNTGRSVTSEGSHTPITNPRSKHGRIVVQGHCSPLDRDLVQRCIRKEENAWNEFVGRYSRLIYHQIYHCLRARAVSVQREDVEDLCHGVFLALLKDGSRKLRYFEGKCSLASWVKTLTRNEVIDQLRRKQTHVSLDSKDPDGVSLCDRLPDPNPIAEDNLDNAETRATLMHILNKVSPEDRRLAMLTYRSEMPAGEIAAVLGISKQAVYTRKNRLQQKLRKALR